MRHVSWVLALVAIVCLSFYFGPRIYVEYLLGLQNNDGTLTLGFTILTYLVSAIFLVSLVFPKFRRALFPRDSLVYLRAVSTIVIVAYVFWGTVIIYGVSKATDL